MAFEAWVKWRMGSVEITDQEDCVHWAVKQVTGRDRVLEVNRYHTSKVCRITIPSILDLIGRTKMRQ